MNCRRCGKPIRDGEFVKTTWNGEDDEHLECPTAAQFAGHKGETINELEALVERFS